MITKQYSMRLEEELHMVLVDNSNISTNAIKLKTDIVNTSTSLVSSPDRIKNKLIKLTNKTYVSNSANILATDIVVDGVPYFYKLLKVEVSGYTTEYSGNVIIDGAYAYSTTEEVEILLTNTTTGAPTFSVQICFQPVFVDKRLATLVSLEPGDNKTYIVKKKNNKLLISFSKEPLVVLSDDEIFIAKTEIDGNFTSIYIDEFVWNNAIKIDNKNATISYSYFPYSYNLVSNIVEKVKVSNDETVRLSNRLIQHSSVKIIKINNIVSNIAIDTLTCYKTGTVSLAMLVQLGSINVDDDIEISYNYMHISKPIVNVDNRKLNYDSNISCYIPPTSIVSNGTTTNEDMSLHAIISKKEYIVDVATPLATIDISQTGAVYNFDYLVQNSISFFSGFTLSDFYTSTIYEVDNYFQSMLYVNIGTLKINKGSATLIDAYKPATIKEGFKDFDVYKYYSGGILILNGNATISAGVVPVLSEYTYPIEFNIDHETASHYYIKINVEKYLQSITSLVSTDIALLAFSEYGDTVNKDFSIDMNKITICSISDGIETSHLATMYLDQTENMLYAKISKITNTKIYIKYNGMLSQYGIVV